MVECSSQLSGTLDESGEIAEYAMNLAASLVGQRYGFLRLNENSEGAEADSEEVQQVKRDVAKWLPEIA